MPDHPPRLLRATVVVSRQSMPKGYRRWVRWIKCPYSGLYGLNEVLARALSTRQIVRYEIAVMTKDEIDQNRHRVARWQEALSTIPGVDWDA